MKQQYYNPQLPATHADAIDVVCAIMITAMTRLAAACRLPVNTYFGNSEATRSNAKGTSRARSGTMWHGLCRILLIAALALTAATPAMAQEGLNVNKGVSAVRTCQGLQDGGDAQTPS